MKRILTFLLLLTPLLIMNAQAPEGINYQAVARNASGDILTNQSLTVRISIHEGSATGTTVYGETHNVSTNDFGLFDLVIGEGTTTVGTFAGINWGSSNFYLQLEVDDGSGFVDLGTSQFVSVPYALYAKEAGSSGGGDDWGSQVVQSDATLSGNGTAGNNLGLAQQGASSGEVLKWNGSSWAPAADNTGGGGTSPWQTNGSAVYYDGGDVGIGQSNPTSALDLNGTFELADGPEAFDFDVLSNGDLEIRANTTNMAMVIKDEAPYAIGLGTTPAGNYNVEIAGDSMLYAIDGTADIVMTSRTDGIFTDPVIMPTSGGFGKIGTGDQTFFEIHSQNYFAPSSGDYQTYSDSRIKENITVLQDPIEKIQSIKGISYDLRESFRGKSERSSDERFNHIGLLAQDVEKVFPELVQTNQETGLKSVGYMGLIPVLVEGIKAQQQQIEQLKKKSNQYNELQQDYEALKGKYEQLEQRLDKVESGR